MVVGDGYEELNPFVDQDDRTAMFSIGTYTYFDYYFTAIIGIEAGLGFLTKGVRFTPVLPQMIRERAVYMEIPVSFKLDYRHFQCTFGLALFVALSGRNTTKTDNEDRDVEWDSDRWDTIHRANLGPRLTLGYAIPVGPIYIVPGLTWMIHLINDLNNDEILGDVYHKVRATNVMFNIGVEWGF
jgi:hypothetical protein